MLNLLNATRVSDALFWMLVILGIFLIVEVAVFAILFISKKQKAPAEKSRKVVSITLDTQVVRREYKVGDKFDPSGLLITAHYDDEPCEEPVREYIVVTPELIKKLAREDKNPEDLVGCRIYAPDLSVEGKPMVNVTFMDQTAAYAISVVEPEPVVEEPAPKPVQVVAAPQVDYVVVVSAPEELTALQVALYNGDTKIGNAVNVEGGTAKLTAEAGDYAVKVSGVPEGYNVTAATLSGTRHICSITITAPVHEEIAVAADPVVEQPAEPIVIAEESFEGGVLRYDRSFTARLIQASNEVKEWYTELKNDLLSYKKVHDRMSWKRESYNFGRQSFARLAFRGETLCLYLPLNPETFTDTKYKVESVTDSTAYADTPCLYRIKNNKRVQYAKELIATVAEQYATPNTEREAQDYFVPYEGIVELINKGLVKRTIKDKSSEIFFEKKTQETK